MVDNTGRTLVQKLIDQRDLTTSRVVDENSKRLMEMVYNDCIVMAVEDASNRADVSREQAIKSKALKLDMVDSFWGTH